MALSKIQQTENLNNIRAKTLEIALYATNPGRNNTGTEIAASGGYARKSITFTAPQDGGNGMYISNDTLIDFGACTGDYSAPVAYYAVFEVAGDMVFYGPIQELGVNTTRTYRVGDHPRFAANVVVHWEKD